MFKSIIIITLILSSCLSLANDYNQQGKLNKVWDNAVQECQKFKSEFASEAFNVLKKSSTLSGNFKSFKPYPNNTPSCSMSASEDNRGYYCVGICKFSDWEGTYVNITLGEANWRRKSPNDSKLYYDIESLTYESTL